jgi:hypothetical protein
MTNYKKDESLSPGSWYRWKTPKGYTTMFCDPYGHAGSLEDHNIADDGTVSPSVVCAHDNCLFHEWIKLEDWDAQ